MEKELTNALKKIQTKGFYDKSAEAFGYYKKGLLSDKEYARELDKLVKEAFTPNQYHEYWTPVNKEP